MGFGIALLVGIGAAAVVRALSARRVGSGDRRAIPMMLFATLVVAILFAAVGAWAATRSLALGVPVLIGALVLGGGWLRVSLDAARTAPRAQPAPDHTDALIERLDRSYRAIAAALMAAGFAGAAAAIVYLLLLRGRF